MRLQLAAKRATMALGLAMACLVTAVAYAQSDDDAGNLVRVNAKDAKQPIQVKTGDLLEIDFRFPVVPDQMIGALRLEVGGDAIERLGVLRVPNVGPDGKPIVGVGIIGAFVTASEVGQGVIRITPYIKGKPQPMQEFKVNVTE